MSRKACFILLSLVALVYLCSAVNAQSVIYPEADTIQPTVWPKPLQLTLDATQPNGGATLYANPDDFSITFDNGAADRSPLNAQAATIRNRLFPLPAQAKNDPTLAQLTGLFVHVSCMECPFSIDSSQATSTETYNFTIARDATGNGVAQIFAPTAWGAIWGLETFIQLLTLDNGNYLLYNSSVTIWDEPFYQYRGLMLDTSHHFIPMVTMNRIIDGMSANKLNVLHWSHKSAVALSIQSTIYPELTAETDGQGSGGSYDEAEATYTQAQVFTLVQYAKDRGIHVIIENGGLEQSAALGKSHPELMACPSLVQQGYPMIENIAMDPTLNATIAFLANYWQELDQSSTDYIHVGGDKIDYTDCWANSPNIQKYMASTGKSYDDIQHDYIVNIWNNVLPNLFSNNQSIMFRADENSWPGYPVDNGFSPAPQQVLFQAMDMGTLRNITIAGLDVIYSGPNWDLTGPLTQARNPAAGLWDIFDDFVDIYLTNPVDGVADTGFVLGGQISAYTFQADAQNIESLLWPRGSAAAEALWTNVSATTQGVDDSVLYRLQTFVCSLQRRGLKATALRPGFCSTLTRSHESSSGKVSVSWILFGFMIAFSVIGVLYSLSVVLSTISHLRAGTKAAVTASLNAPLMEQ